MDLKTFFTERPAPLYDKEFHDFGQSLVTSDVDLFNSADSGAIFKKEFNTWVTSSASCNYLGLEAFEHRDVIQGVTSFIDDIYQMHPGNVFTLDRDYMYHKRLYGDRYVLNDINDIPNNSHLIFSIPFPSIGDVRPDTSAILETCSNKNVNVHIDAAWVGCARNITFNFDHPAINSIGFSLSKGLGLGYSRIGVRYARNRNPGPVTIMNDFTMIPRPLCWWGIEFMRKFGHDHLQNKYYKYYQKLCSDYNLIETKCIHLAYINDSGEPRPIGIRRAIEYLQKNDRS